MINTAIDKHGGHRKPSSSTATNELSYINLYSLNNLKNSEKQKKIIKINKYIKIATHNVRGFNVEFKQHELFDKYEHLNIDIIGITETKLNEKQSRITLNNYKKYKSWWTGIPDQNKTGGVGIAVKKGLDLHVANVICKLGRLISIDLFFKGSAKTRIINIYVNCNEQEKVERDNLLNELNKLVNEAENKNYNIIIMGDFNADAEKFDLSTSNKIKGKYKIIQNLRDKDFYDIQAITNIEPLKYTWKKNEITKRRIDYIWVSEVI